jgi:hypothetical protein
MAFTPRQQFVIEQYLIEGKPLIQVRRALNRHEENLGVKLRPVSTDHLKVILAKAGKRAIFYSNYFEKKRAAEGK